MEDNYRAALYTRVPSNRTLRCGGVFSDDLLWSPVGLQNYDLGLCGLLRPNPSSVHRINSFSNYSAAAITMEETLDDTHDYWGQQVWLHLNFVLAWPGFIYRWNVTVLKLVVLFNRQIFCSNLSHRKHSTSVKANRYKRRKTAGSCFGWLNREREKQKRKQKLVY